MQDTTLFTYALGLTAPWYVTDVKFIQGDNGSELHITIDHKDGYQFLSDDDHYYSVYDHVEKTWRHLDFFQHICYIHARVPRVRNSKGNTLMVDVPWASPGSSFTLLFEAYAMLLVHSGMSLSAGGEYMSIDGRIIGRIIKRNVAVALAEQPLNPVKQLGLDETSYQKGHQYITVLTDKEEKKVVGLGYGKDVEAVGEALLEMEIRGADRKKVETISLDFSPAYIAACKKYFKKAAKVFDRFHLECLLNKIVDQIRREDQKHNTVLKKTRYLWLKNASNLKDKQKQIIELLGQTCPRIGIVYRLKEQFKEVWQEPEIEKAKKLLRAWLTLALNTKIEQVVGFVKTVKKHWRGIITYFIEKATNAFAEQANLKIQEIKRVAKGYRNLNNFYTMIYFHLGKLELNLPTKNG